MYNMKAKLLLSLFLILTLINITSSNFITEQLNSLPRYNRGGNAVSSDISDFTIFDCTGNVDDRSCDIIIPKIEDLKDMNSGDSTDTISSYIDGVFAYGVINFLFSFLVIILTTFYLLCGIFCCLLSLCGCCKKEKSFFKPKTRKNLTNSCLMIFILTLASAAFFGYTKGGSQLLSFLPAISEAPSGISNLIQSEAFPINSFFISMVSTVVAPFISSLNTTLHNGLNFEMIHQDLLMIEYSITLLPDLNTIGMSLDDTQGAVDSVLDIISLISNDFVNINIVKENITSYVGVIEDDLDSIDQSLNDIGLTLNNMGGTIVYFNDQIGFIKRNVSLITDDLVTLSSCSNISAACFPMPAAFLSACNNASSSMTELTNGNLDGNPADLANLNSKLTDIYFQIARLPNYDDTAGYLYSINQTIWNIIQPLGALDDIAEQTTILDQKLTQIPTTDTILYHLNQLFNAISYLSLADISTHVQMIQPVVDSLPVIINNLVAEINKIPVVVPVLMPVIYDLLITRVDAFNRTIAEVPFDTLDLYNTVNDTINDNMGSITDIIADVNSTLDTVTESINITSYTNIINDVQSAISDQVESFNFTDITDSMGDMNTNFASNYSEFSTFLSDMKISLYNALIANETIASIYRIQYSRAIMEIALQEVISPIGDYSTWNTPTTVIGDYLLLAQGVCDVDTSVYCDSNADCTSGACSHIGAYRCSSSGSSSQIFTPCTLDSDCSSLINSHCLNDFNRATIIYGILYAFGNPQVASSSNIPDVSSTISAFGDVEVTGDYNITQIIIDLNQASVDIIDVGVSEYKDQLVDVLSGLNDTDFTEINDTLIEAIDSINSVDFSSFNDTLKDIKSRKSEYQSNLNDTIEFIAGLITFFYNENELHSYLDDISTINLENILSNQGSGAMILSVGTTFDSMISYFQNLMDNFKDTYDYSITNVNVKEKMAFGADIMDRITSNPDTKYKDNDKYGSLYYLTQLSNISSDYTVNIYDTSVDSFEYDSSGDKYNDGLYCVTKDCFEESSHFYNEEPLPLPSMIPVPLTLTNVSMGLWFPVALVILLALLTFCCPLCFKNNTLRSCPACLMIGVIIFMLPLFFIITGLLFPVSVVLSDVCLTGPSIGVNYVESYGDGLCKMIGGTGTVTNCKYEKYDFDVTVNLVQIAKGIFNGECNGLNDPFSSPLKEIASQLQYIPINVTIKYIDKNPGTFETIRQPVLDIIISTAGASGISFYELFTDNADNVFICDNMELLLSEVLNPICDNAVGSISWLFSMLYISAWILFCCGIPAGCLVQHNNKWTEKERIIALAIAKDEANGKDTNESDVILLNHDGYVDVDAEERNSNGELVENGDILEDMEGDYYNTNQSQEGYSAIAMTNIGATRQNKSIRLTEVVPVGGKNNDDDGEALL